MKKFRSFCIRTYNKNWFKLSVFVKCVEIFCWDFTYWGMRKLLIGGGYDIFY